MNSLKEVAEKLLQDNKKIKLLYAFNGTGKTRLSMEVKNKLNLNNENEEEKSILYYNAFTEDLFHWDNDLESNESRKFNVNLKSNFIKSIFDQGKSDSIIEKFQEYTKMNINTYFNYNNGEIIFKLPAKNNEPEENIKISKGEESLFIWSIFYVFIETVIEDANDEERSMVEYDKLKYIYIDDPISSLDDNFVFEVARDIKKLMRSAKGTDLNFIISTHHALFFNILYNEIRNDRQIKNNHLGFYTFTNDGVKYRLETTNDSPFGYHLLLKNEIENAIINDKIYKYHFQFFRNLLEKTANYLGYTKWSECIIGKGVVDDNRELYVRKINSFSHSKHTDPENKELHNRDKNTLKLLFENFIEEFKWKKE